MQGIEKTSFRIEPKPNRIEFGHQNPRGIISKAGMFQSKIFLIRMMRINDIKEA